MKGFTFGRKDRLKSRKRIEQLFREGKVITLMPLRVLYLISRSDDPQLQCGVGAGTRIFRKAVDRNRVKRLIREAWRLQKQPVVEKLKAAQCQMSLFIIYTGKELPVYKDTFAVINTLVQKLDTIIGSMK